MLLFFFFFFSIVLSLPFTFLGRGIFYFYRSFSFDFANTPWDVVAHFFELLILILLISLYFSLGFISRLAVGNTPK